MEDGRILAASQDGAYVIRLTGDVRLTLCTTIDDYVQKMLENPEFASVWVDLCAAEGIDSTTLGLLAKLALEVRARACGSKLLSRWAVRTRNSKLAPVSRAASAIRRRGDGRASPSKDSGSDMATPDAAPGRASRRFARSPASLPREAISLR